MRLEIHLSPQFKEAIMALSKDFQNLLDTLTQMVGQERAAQALAIQQAVEAQAEKDQAAIASAAAAQAAAEAERDSDVAEITAERDALQAKLDELFPPAPPSPPPPPPPPVDGSGDGGAPAGDGSGGDGSVDNSGQTA